MTTTVTADDGAEKSELEQGRDAANSMIAGLEDIYDHNEDLTVQKIQEQSSTDFRIVLEASSGGVVASFGAASRIGESAGFEVDDMLAHDSGNLSIYVNVDE